MFPSYPCSGITLSSQVLGWKAFKPLENSSHHNLTATRVRTPQVPLPRHLHLLSNHQVHIIVTQLESACLKPIKAWWKLTVNDFQKTSRTWARASYWRLNRYWFWTAFTRSVEFLLCSTKTVILPPRHSRSAHRAVLLLRVNLFTEHTLKRKRKPLSIGQNKGVRKTK